jgi:hypothetical protein
MAKPALARGIGNIGFVLNAVTPTARAATTASSAAAAMIP